MQLFKHTIPIFAIFANLLLSPGIVWGSEYQVNAQIEKLSQKIESLTKTVSQQQLQISELKQIIVDLNPDFTSDQKKEASRPSTTGIRVRDRVNDPLKGFELSGQLRLRYEAIAERPGSASSDRNRFRYLLRYGFDKSISEEWKIGFHMASGAIGSIGSRYDTFDSQAGTKAIGIDRIYAEYRPQWAKGGRINDFKIKAGKFYNPFREGSSLMIWDADVTMEGIYERVEVNLFKNNEWDAKGYVTAGQIIIEEGAGSDSDDSELWAYQMGFNTKIITNEKNQDVVQMRNSISFYNYDDFSVSGNFGASAGNFVNPSNATELATTDFNIVSTNHSLGFQFKYLPPVTLSYEYASNLAENANDGLGGGQSKAWNLGLKLGKVKGKKSWDLSYYYIWSEANALPGVFTDAAFGFADRRGSHVQGRYALTDDMILQVKGLFSNRISADFLTRDEERRRFQVDLIWKF